MDDSRSANQEIPTLIASEQAQTLGSSNLLDLLFSDLGFSVLGHCTAVSLVRLCKANRDARRAVTDYMGSSFNIDKILSRYFSDPKSFRSLQSQTGTLISGSTALQFFDRSFYPESDLDLYVHMSWRIRVAQWLFNEGYIYVPWEKQDPNFEVAINHQRLLLGRARYAMTGVAGVFTFVKRLVNSPFSEMKVQMIIAAFTPMEAILNFHSTCVMNVISFEKAYCLFPRATLEERISLCTARSQRAGSPAGALRKYQDRGWLVLPSWSEAEGGKLFTNGNRFLGDRHTWTIPFNLTGVSLPDALTSGSAPLSHDPVVASNWVFHTIPDRGAKATFNIITNQLLHYQYVGRNVTRIQGLEDILHDNGTLQTLQALRGAERKYFDDQFIQFTHLCELATERVAQEAARVLERIISDIGEMFITAVV